MIIPRLNDALHRSRLYQLLIAVADDPILSKYLIFKGGTCAAMLGYLDRFSVDLDFDISPKSSIDQVKRSCKSVFLRLNLSIKGQSSKVIQYKLGYSSKPNQRNTIQFDAISKPYKTDQHEHKLLSDIDRYMLCQNMPTMFSHKLVAVTDRYNKHKMVAGRDIYDIYYFFINGNKYNPAIIEERTNLQPKAYLTNLHDFISKHISDVDLSNDLNTLLPYKTFNSLRNSLKSLVLDLLTQEIKRI